MVYEQIILGVDAIALVFLLLAMIFLIKNRIYERSEFENSINTMVFGIFFLFIMLLVNILNYANLSYHDALARYIPDITTYVSYMVTITEIAIIPLFAICFLVGVFLARENF